MGNSRYRSLPLLNSMITNGQEIVLLWGVSKHKTRFYHRHHIIFDELVDLYFLSCTNCFSRNSNGSNYRGFHLLILPPSKYLTGHSYRTFPSQKCLALVGYMIRIFGLVHDILEFSMLCWKNIFKNWLSPAVTKALVKYTTWVRQLPVFL